MLSLLLNVLWIVFGGFISFVAWALVGVLAFISIIGIPWGRACFTIAFYSLLPFGREAIERDLLTGQQDIGTSSAGTLGNIIWFVLAGWWIALGHLVLAVGFAVTIIGIPFAWAHLKLAGLALFPIGKEIVDNDVAEEARRRAAAATLDGRRGL